MASDAIGIGHFVTFGASGVALRQRHGRGRPAGRRGSAAGPPGPRASDLLRSPPREAGRTRRRPGRRHAPAAASRPAHRCAGAPRRCARWRPGRCRPASARHAARAAARPGAHRRRATYGGLLTTRSNRRSPSGCHQSPTQNSTRARCVAALRRAMSSAAALSRSRMTWRTGAAVLQRQGDGAAAGAQVEHLGHIDVGQAPLSSSTPSRPGFRYPAAAPAHRV